MFFYEIVYSFQIQSVVNLAVIQSFFWPSA